MTDYVFPHPEGTTWERWRDTVVGYNPALRNQLSTTLSWEQFADRVTLVLPGTPRPDFFDSWQDWAVALKRALQS